MISVFELIMLICFGLSWPFSAYKSWKAGTTKGKSLVFLIAIWIGYVSGILHKMLFSLDFVLAIYIFNLSIVSLDLIFYMRNYRRDKTAATIQTQSARQTPQI